MLYFASKVSSRDPARGSDSPVSRPFMMMTRKEMPLRYPHKHEVAMKTRTRATRLGPRRCHLSRESCVERCVRREVWVGRGSRRSHGPRTVSHPRGDKHQNRVVEGGPLGGEGGATGPRGFFRFFSFVFRALLFLSLHDRDGFCLFQTHTPHHTTPPGQGCVLFSCCCGRRPQGMETTNWWWLGAFFLLLLRPSGIPYYTTQALTLLGGYD